MKNSSNCPTCNHKLELTGSGHWAFCPECDFEVRIKPDETLEQKYSIEYNWLQQADEQLYDAVIGALESMANGGACSMNPPIFGAFVELGILEKRRTASELLGIFEALS